MKNGKGKPIGGAYVDVWYIDWEGREVKKRVKTDLEGRFEFSWLLPNEAVPGKYTVYAKYGEVTSTTTFEVLPVPGMEVAPKYFRASLKAGESTSFTIKVKEKFGLLPLENVKVYVDQKHPPGNMPSSWVSFDKTVFSVPAGGSVVIKCTINVPENAAIGEYRGYVTIDGGHYETVELSKTVVIHLNVEKDEVKPEITIISPNDGEIINARNVIVKGVVKDDVGVKEVYIEVRADSTARTYFVEVEEGSKIVDFEREVRVYPGENEIIIVAKDVSGNVATESVSVECVPPSEEKPIVIVSPPKLEWIDVSIEPKNAEVKPGEELKYKITLNWYPPEWRGEVKISGVISAAGFQKSFDIPPVEPTSDPPVVSNISVPIPENVLPLTYKFKLTVSAENVSDSEEVEVKVVSEGVPGFEVLATFAALAIAVRKFVRR